MEDKFPAGFYMMFPHKKYNGYDKNLTKDCGGCDFYLEIPDLKPRCYWGVAWKVLDEIDKPVKCMLDFEKSPRKIAFDKLSEDEKEKLSDLEKTSSRFSNDAKGRLHEKWDAWHELCKNKKRFPLF